MTWTKAAWVEAVCFDTGEEYTVAAIKQHLLSEEHRKLLYDRKLSIEDLLNGRVEGDQTIYETIFADWNTKLGWKEFGWFSVER